VKINLKEPYQVEKKFSEALFKLGGQLDVLILCHGYIKHESIIQTNILEWDSMMNLNVRTHFQLISLAIPFLKKQMEKDKASLPALLREKESLKAKLDARDMNDQAHQKYNFLVH